MHELSKPQRMLGEALREIANVLYGCAGIPLGATV